MHLFALPLLVALNAAGPSNTETTITLVTVEASVFADYDLVSFDLTASAKGQNSKEAKAALEPKVQAIAQAIKDLQAKGVKMPADTRSSTMSGGPNYKYNKDTGEQTPDGYQVTYSLWLESPSVAAASEIQNAFTSIDGVRVGSPNFSLKNTDPLREAALREAKKKADQEIAMRCKVLGIDPGSLKPRQFKVAFESSGSDQRRAPGRSAMAADASKVSGVNIESGRAYLTCGLQIEYVRKE